jgi:hypothetical protein
MSGVVSLARRAGKFPGGAEPTAAPVACTAWEPEASYSKSGREKLPPGSAGFPKRHLAVGFSSRTGTMQRNRSKREARLRELASKLFFRLEQHNSRYSLYRDLDVEKLSGTKDLASMRWKTC